MVGEALKWSELDIRFPKAALRIAPFRKSGKVRCWLRSGEVLEREQLEALDTTNKPNNHHQRLIQNSRALYITLFSSGTSTRYAFFAGQKRC